MPHLATYVALADHSEKTWRSLSAPSPTVTPGRPTSSTPATPWPAGASNTARTSPRSSSATASRTTSTNPSDYVPTP